MMIGCIIIVNRFSESSTSQKLNLPILKLMNFFNFLFTGTTFVIVLMYTSIFEWALHRYVMHRIIFGFKYAYKAHHEVHHGLFKADETYHLRDRDKKVAKTIPMAWWNGPVLIVIATLPSVPFSLWFNTWSITATCAITIAAYYGVYERTHWCMHLPKKRRIMQGWWFKKLNGHHLLHHRYKGSHNFNVVLPFADLIFGTLMLRAKTHFAQATGHNVPDVQPKIVPPDPFLDT